MTTQEDFDIRITEEPRRQRIRHTREAVVHEAVDDDLRRIVKRDVIDMCGWIKTTVKVACWSAITVIVFSSFTFCLAWLLLIFKGV